MDEIGFYCIRCGVAINPLKNECHNCGYCFDPRLDEEVHEAIKSGGDCTRCYCGVPAHKTSLYCSVCGRPLSPPKKKRGLFDF